MRWLLSAAWSGLCLLGIVAGIPAVLIVMVGWPLPRHLPHPRQWATWAGQPLTGGALRDVLACIMWLLWIAIMYLLAVTIVAQARNVRMPTIRLATPLQGLVTGLAGAAAIALTTAASRGHAAPTPTPPAVADLHPTPGSIATAAAITEPTAPGTVVSPTADESGHVTLLLGDQQYLYTVHRGDNLSTIAKHWLGDADRWPEIYHLNKGHHFADVGGTLTNPNLIYPGWVLHLPADARPPGHITPTPRAPGRTSTHPRPLTSPAPATSTQPTAPSTATTTPPATHVPPTAAQPHNAAPNPDPGPSASPATAPIDTHTAPHKTTGVDLPGGWVSLPFAAAITAAGAIVWLQRRRLYRPRGRPATAVTADPDLQPLPRAATLMRRAVSNQAPQLLEHRSTPTIAEYTANPDPATLPTGPSATTLAGLGAPASAGLGLVGAGADAAARALLVATLSAGTIDDPDNRSHVIIPADTFTRLLGAADIGIAAMPRLTITTTLSDALTRIEEAIIERRRLVAESGFDDLDSLHSNAPLHSPVPPMLLLADTPTRTTHARAASTVVLGAPLAITVVVLGDWPAGAVLHVAADGTTPDPAQRLATLDKPTTADLLRMLSESHTGTPPGPVQPPTSVSADQPDTSTATRDNGAHITPSAPASRVLLRTFGEPAVIDLHGNHVPGMRGYATQLMVYLAVHRQGASFNDIMEAFWPDAHVGPARDRLSTEVGDLRRTIRKAHNNNPGIQPVRNLGRRYQLDADLVDVDLWSLASALRRANTAENTAGKIAALEDAIAAGQGVLAGDQSWDWIESAREHTRRHAVAARLGLAELVASTDSTRATSLVAEAIALDPHSETVAQQAMHIYATLGNVDMIRSELARLRDALNDIDEEPTEETLRLADRLIRS